MPRNKLSEYRSKHIVNSIIGNSYVGWSIGVDMENIDAISGFDAYVVKVDQAVKKRFKSGLVSLDVNLKDIPEVIRQFAKKGYKHFIVEPYIPHHAKDERYLSFQQERRGVIVSYSAKGGVNIEDNASSIESVIFNKKNVNEVSKKTKLSVEVLGRFLDGFERLHMTLLEINPYAISNDAIIVLDAAIEVDSTAAHLVRDWSEGDFRYATLNYSTEELAVRSLNDDSSASFNLSILNKNGSIFLLLSGGGASVVIADEIYSLGLGEEIANYGEYSGNPTRHETYLYTCAVLGLVVKSNASSKVLFIGGAVANFTDIATTFNGVIDALRDYSTKLKKSKLKVYVRRGGPREKEGLESIKEVLAEMDILGGVYDPSTSISKAVHTLVEGMRL